MKLPTKIPVTVPWEAHEWPPQTVGEFTSDERLTHFIAEWQNELNKRPGGNEYMELVLAHCGFSRDGSFSPETLISLLWKTVDLVSNKPLVVEHPVAAFELVSVMDGLARFASESFSKKQKSRIEESHTAVSGAVIIFAYQAVDRHFKDMSVQN